MLMRVLEQHHGIRNATLTQIERGHTNESFEVTTPTERFVLRLSWPGKPAAQIVAEEHLLSTIAQDIPFDVPRIIPTRSGAAHAVDEGRVLHLFTPCRGTPGPRYLASGDDAIREAMSCLAELHRALAPLACSKRPGWDWLAERLVTVRAGDLASLPARTDFILDRIAALIPTDSATDVQWLHGDYQLGNLLWTDDRITGVVDFDETGCGSPATEAAMALFALARQPEESSFTYDSDLWTAGLAAYGSAIDADRAHLMQLFCAYQVLIHLAAAQRGLWTLDAGIGFWPCWNALIE